LRIRCRRKTRYEDRWKADRTGRGCGEAADEGVSDKEIARALGIELATVKKHVGNICRKLGARNRTEAAESLAEEFGFGK